jgi:hypothetical protein
MLYDMGTGGEALHNPQLDMTSNLNAKLVAVANQIIIETGCNKETAILTLIRGFINEGLPAAQALDLVCGAGTAAAMANEAWEAFQPA